jgi:transcriptional regulator with XRE-family HTH domain
MKHKPDFIDREIGRRLRVARISANIRQYRAAKAVGVTYQQMRKYEVGYNRVSAVIVARLAQIYRRPVEWFLEEVRLQEEAKADALAGSIAQADHFTRASATSDRPEHTGN